MTPMLMIGLVGGAVAAVVWLAIESLVRSARPVMPSPERPPALWRLAGPLIHLLTPMAARVLVAPGGRLAVALRRAALDRALTPAQFQAGRLVAGGLSALLVALPLSRSALSLATPMLLAALIGWALPRVWLHERASRLASRMLKELPFFLDVLTLSLESGLNLTGALNQAIDKGPPGPMRQQLMRVARDLRAGRRRDEALRDLADRTGLPQVGSLVSALITAERQGASLGAILRAQAEQRRNERFHRAEKLAMEAPVKMLLPLLLFVFPCTFLILFFPVVSRVLAEGWMR